MNRPGLAPALGQKHTASFYENAFRGLSKAAEIAGTVSSIYSAGRAVAPYVTGAVRLGAALI